MTSDAQPGRKQYGWFVAAIVGVILYLTLFPFDFSRAGAGTWRDALQHPVRVDFVQNVLLFVPLGFALAGRLRRCGWWMQLVAGTAVGAALTLAVEAGQLFLLRNTSIWDLMANTAGAAGGVLLFLLAGRRLEGAAFGVWRRVPRWQRAAFFLLLALLVWGASVGLQRQVRVDNWDASYPLVVANELSGDRPWQGTVRLVQLADRALSPEEIERLLADGGETAVVAPSWIGRYQLDAAGRVVDSTGHLPALQRRQTDGQPWWATTGPVTAWTERAQASAAFTLSVVAAAAEAQQTGPARIVSVSTDPFHRNVTLGQEGSDLVLRVRTVFSGENGRKPELVIPGVFADQQFHHVVVRYDQTAVWIYVDDVTRAYSFSWTPANLLMWLLSPIEATQFRPNAFSNAIFHLVYVGVLLGFLLASLSQLWSPAQQVT